jgi:chromosome segregation ATPase
MPLPQEQTQQQKIELFSKSQIVEKKLRKEMAANYREQDEVNNSLLPKAKALDKALKEALSRNSDSKHPSAEVQTITQKMIKVHQELSKKRECINKHDAKMREYESQLRNLKKAFMTLEEAPPSNYLESKPG